MAGMPPARLPARALRRPLHPFLPRAELRSSPLRPVGRLRAEPGAVRSPLAVRAVPGRRSRRVFLSHHVGAAGGSRPGGQRRPGTRVRLRGRREGKVGRRRLFFLRSALPLLRSSGVEGSSKLPRDRSESRSFKAKARTSEEFPVLVNHLPVIRKFMFAKRFADEICKGRECLSVIKILAEPDFNGSLLCALMGTGSVSECGLK